MDHSSSRAGKRFDEAKREGMCHLPESVQASRNQFHERDQSAVVFPLPPATQPVGAKELNLTPIRLDKKEQEMGRREVFGLPTSRPCYLSSQVARNRTLRVSEATIRSCPANPSLGFKPGSTDTFATDSAPANGGPTGTEEERGKNT